MIRKAMIILMIVLSFAVFGCSKAVTPVQNTVELANTDFSKVSSMKHGIACSYYLFGLLGPFGSPKLTSAIEDAGISKVAVVDYSGGYYLLVSRECIEVYGE